MKAATGFDIRPTATSTATARSGRRYPAGAAVRRPVPRAPRPRRRPVRVVQLRLVQGPREGVARVRDRVLRGRRGKPEGTGESCRARPNRSACRCGRRPSRSRQRSRYSGSRRSKRTASASPRRSRRTTRWSSSLAWCRLKQRSCRIAYLVPAKNTAAARNASAARHQGRGIARGHRPRYGRLPRHKCGQAAAAVPEANPHRVGRWEVEAGIASHPRGHAGGEDRAAARRASPRTFWSRGARTD